MTAAAGGSVPKLLSCSLLSSSCFEGLRAPLLRTLLRRRLVAPHGENPPNKAFSRFCGAMSVFVLSLRAEALILISRDQIRLLLVGVRVEPCTTRRMGCSGDFNNSTRSALFACFLFELVESDLLAAKRHRPP